jgi:hypothetical protein
MIITNREMAYLNWYVLEKESKYTDRVREAINKIHFLIRNKKLDLALAIHIVNDKSADQYGIKLGKKFLWKLYSKRCAHIKHGKDEFRKLEFLKRLSDLPVIEEKNLCACGCGNEIGNDKVYKHGHNPRFKSEEEKQLYLESIRNLRKNKKSKKVIYLKDVKKEVL